MAAGTPSNSVIKTASGSVTTKASVLTGFTLAAQGDAAKAVVTDGNGGVSKLVLITTAGAITAGAHIPEGGIECPNGIYVVITGTTPDACVQYRELMQ